VYKKRGLSEAAARVKSSFMFVPPPSRPHNLSRVLGEPH